MPLVTVPLLRERWESSPGVVDRKRWRETSEILDILDQLAWAEQWAPTFVTRQPEEVLL